MGIIFLFVALVAVSAVAVTVSNQPAKITPERSSRPPNRAPVHVAEAATQSPDRVVAAAAGKAFCIGGTRCPDYCKEPGRSCEPKSSYTMKLDRPTAISRIELHAHDDIGPTRAAELVVKLDGRQLGKFPVRWEGSTLSVPVRRTGRLIAIEARDPRGNRFAGEEAVISDIQVFGRTPR